MGRAGIEPATLGLKVRKHEPRRTATNGNVLQFVRIGTATNCTRMRSVETNVYARSGVKCDASSPGFLGVTGRGPLRVRAQALVLFRCGWAMRPSGGVRPRIRVPRSG